MKHKFRDCPDKNAGKERTKCLKCKDIHPLEVCKFVKGLANPTVNSMQEEDHNRFNEEQSSVVTGESIMSVGIWRVEGGQYCVF